MYRRSFSRIDMNKPRISAIAALSENNVIGIDNKLPWHIPADFKRLKELTMGATLVMGRKTHESIGRLLPGRTTIIVTRDKDYQVEGAIIAHSIDEAIQKAQHLPVIARSETTKQSGKDPHVAGAPQDENSSEIFIFGGGQIFEQAMPLINRLYLTIVHTTLDGDAYFPDYSDFTREIERIDGEDNGLSYTFLTLERE